MLIDTNILLLLFVGSYDQTLIPTFKRTKIFSSEDYQLLTRLIQPFRKIYTSPNVLTEVSNHAGYLFEPYKTPFFEKFREKIVDLDEHFIASSTTVWQDEFIRFGLTDSTIAYIAKMHNVLVLTDDFRLSQYLNHANIDALNFNHIRMAGWSSF